jgi:hypothetical protein
VFADNLQAKCQRHFVECMAKNPKHTHEADDLVWCIKERKKP